MSTFFFFSPHWVIFEIELYVKKFLENSIAVSGYLFDESGLTIKVFGMILQVQSSLSGNYKVDSHLNLEHNQKGQLKEESENSPRQLKGPRIGLQTENGLILVFLFDVVRIESSNNYCFVYLSNKQSIFVSKSLKNFERCLGSYHFIRIHNSHIINLNYLDKIVKEGNHYAIMYDGNKLPISRRKYLNVMNLVRNYTMLVI